uniref:Uncharacterized protein n=2 Tax=unclassified Caudoviricetes TaxID=2788787 RepID=A0A8S5PID8_9CAUD|nr:MAG TPA: hypothetical protein [Siphoviridae sp. ctJcm18]DAE06674.1 MAG TPA: hypothetical protein [Siphoviridae sp. ctUGQ45]
MYRHLSYYNDSITYKVVLVKCLMKGSKENEIDHQ